MDKDEEFEQKVQDKNDDLKQKLLMEDEDLEKVLKFKNNDFEEKVLEIQRKMDVKNTELLRVNTELMRKNEDVQKRMQRNRVDFQAKISETDEKVEQGKKNVLGLKAHQRELEGKISQMEEDLFMDECTSYASLSSIYY
jgi:hypothetical protein